MLFEVRSDYDEEADVLYISFGDPEPADDSDITDEGIIVRLREGKIVGLTILNAGSSVWQGLESASSPPQVK